MKYFIVYHPALTYYARDYGLRQVAIEADGKEPSAKQLTAVIRQAREAGVRRIFYQNLSLIHISARRRNNGSRRSAKFDSSGPKQS